MNEMRQRGIGRYFLPVTMMVMLITIIFGIIPMEVSAQPIPLSFEITVTTSGGQNRFFSVSSGDTLVQIVNPLYTVSTSTNAMFTTRETFTGSVSGDLTGTLTGGAFNTIWVDITATSMRGLTAGHATYSDSTGSIELIMALDVEATLSGGIIVSASLKGYAFSKSTTAGYSGKIVFAQLEGSLTATNKWSFIGRGWILNQAQCPDNSFTVSGSRATMPGVTRSVGLRTSDTVMQFTRNDITLPADASAEFTTRQRLTGTMSGGITGSFTLDSNAFIITAGTHAGKGFSIARFTFTRSPSTVNGFLILDNTNFGQHNGFIVGVSGTGEFANKILIGDFQGTFTTPPAYYDYQGSGSVRICSLPIPVGGEIITQNIKNASSGIPTALWILGAILIMIVTVTVAVSKRRK